MHTFLTAIVLDFLIFSQSVPKTNSNQGHRRHNATVPKELRVLLLTPSLLSHVQWDMLKKTLRGHSYKGMSENMRFFVIPANLLFTNYFLKVLIHRIILLKVINTMKVIRLNTFDISLVDTKH